MGAAQVLGVDPGGESVGAVVGDAHGVGLGVEGDDRQDRAEDLLLGDPHAVVHAGEHGRQEVQARRQIGRGPFGGPAGAAGAQDGAFLLPDLDVRADLVELAPVGERSEEGRRIARVAGLEGGGPGDEPFDHLVVDGALEQQPGVEAVQISPLL